jgi:hypothetical protein
VLGSASATAFNKVRKTAHVASCGNHDRTTSVIETCDGGGSSPFCSAATLDANRSAAFASTASVPCDEFY